MEVKKYQVKATFFIVIKNANQNLDLIERMKAEGHEIAFHSYKHQSAWELTPWETLKEIPKGEEQLKAQNIKFSYVRPPWGTFCAISRIFSTSSDTVFFPTITSYTPLCQSKQ